MEWTDEMILRLEKLWEDCHSTAEIGRRLGVSKSAVVGKVQRLDLPARPSPIRRDGPAKPRAPKPVHKAATLPALESIAPPVPAMRVAPLVAAAPPAITYGPDIRRLRGARAPSPNPQLFAPTRIAAPPPLADRCLWPLWGHRERPTHKYCDAPADGRWCEAHCLVGYERRPRFYQEFGA